MLKQSDTKVTLSGKKYVKRYNECLLVPLQLTAHMYGKWFKKKI